MARTITITNVEGALVNPTITDENGVIIVTGQDGAFRPIEVQNSDTTLTNSAVGNTIEVNYNSTIVQGAQGYTGSQGIQGDRGFTGSAGPQGYTGSQGVQGVQGYTGSAGATGPQGVIGFTGSKGDQGIQGVIGFTGSKGDQGIQGDIGFTGSKGDIGFTGSKGDQGIQGVIGYTGSQGIQGIQGYTGSKGDIGETGPAGTSVVLKGSVPTIGDLPAGATVGDLYVVLADGNGYVWDGDSWNNVGAIQGPRGYTGSQGIQGIQGYTGSKGDTGALGYTGSKGDIGFTGSKGDQGIQGIQGYTGSKGDIGFTGSQGIQGIQGIQGYTGSQGSIGFTGSKGDQGIQGFTGSQGIQGVTGFTGSQGIQGALGYTGSQGPIGYTGSLGIQGVRGYTGSQGDQGINTGFEFKFNTSATITSTASGELRLNNTNPALVTQIGLSKTTSDSVSLAAMIDAWSISSTRPYEILVKSATASDTSYILLQLTARYDSGTYYVFDATVLGSSTLPDNLENIVLSFWKQGATGNTGAIGYTGSRGATGFTGSQGIQGYTGSQGATGNTGAIGFTGSKGDTGATGFTGSQGIQGYTGSHGAPSGGVAGDLLTKVSSTDYDTAWTSTPIADQYRIDTTATPTRVVGGIQWADGDGTIEVMLKGGNVVLQVGQEQLIRVYNNSGSAFTDGQVVYVNGSHGNRPSVLLASASSEGGSANTIGMVTEPIANGAEGFVTVNGIVRGLDTSAIAEGTALWLSTTSGQYTTTRPTAPNHSVLIGWCIRSDAVVGSIFVNVQNGYELNELHDVYINNIQDGQGLKWVAANSRWENTTVVGYTGSQGPIGYTGSQGIQGIQGIQGYTGSAGTNGTNGAIGYTGSQGIQGALGYTGSQGPIGYTGSQGASGVAGALNDLTDVTLTSSSNGQVLMYNTATSQWINATVVPFSNTVEFLDQSSTNATYYVGISSGATGFQYLASDSALTYNPSTNTLSVGVINSSTLKGYNEGTVYDLGTTSGTITPNVANGNVQKITLNGNLTFNAFTSPVTGQSMTLIVTQDATGSRTLSSTMKFANNGFKTLSTAAGSIDVITIFYDGTNYLASLSKGYA